MSVRKMGLVIAAFACAVVLAGCAQAQPSGVSGSSSGVSNVSSSSSIAASPSASSSSAMSTASTSASASAGKGESVMFDLDYNAGTGFEWTYEVVPEGVVEFVGQETEGASKDPTVAGGPLQERFTFRAVAPGEAVITFNLAREWETGNPPAETQVYAYTVTDDLKMILNPYKSDFVNEPIQE